MRTCACANERHVWRVLFRPLHRFRKKLRGMHSMKISLTVLILVLMPVFARAGQVGTVAPDFSLKDLNGKTVALQQLKGKVVLLDFWAPWCPPCREELPALDALYKKYNNDGLVIIGIDMDDSEKLVAEFLQRAPVSFTILIDRKGTLTREYRFRTLPTAFIVGKDGVIRYQHMGFGKEFMPTYEKEIVELLKQQ